MADTSSCGSLSAPTSLLSDSDAQSRSNDDDVAAVRDMIARRVRARQDDSDADSSADWDSGTDAESESDSDSGSNADSRSDLDSGLSSDDDDGSSFGVGDGANMLIDVVPNGVATMPTGGERRRSGAPASTHLLLDESGHTLSASASVLPQRSPSTPPTTSRSLQRPVATTAAPPTSPPLPPPPPPPPAAARAAAASATTASTSDVVASAHTASGVSAASTDASTAATAAAATPTVVVPGGTAAAAAAAARSKRTANAGRKRRVSERDTTPASSSPTCVHSRPTPSSTPRSLNVSRERAQQFVAEAAAARARGTYNGRRAQQPQATDLRRAARTRPEAGIPTIVQHGKGSMAHRMASELGDLRELTDLLAGDGCTMRSRRATRARMRAVLEKLHTRQTNESSLHIIEGPSHCVL